jgi:uncharacterized protein YcfL
MKVPRIPAGIFAGRIRLLKLPLKAKSEAERGNPVMNLAKRFWVIALCVGMAGCQTERKSDSPSKAALDKRATVDSQLARTVQILGVTPEISADGYLRIQIQIKSLADSTQNFVYKIQWLDQDNAPLDLLEAPVPWSLHRGETSSLVAVAPSPLAKSFRIVFASRP